MNIVTQSQFDETKLSFKQVPQMNNNNFPQHTILFSYKFQSTEDQALILTDPLKVRGKGIPKVDGQWKKHDNDCLDFFLNLDEADGQLLKTQLVDKIDSKFKHLCGNDNSSVNVGDKAVKKLKFVTCNRKFYVNNDDDDDVVTPVLPTVDRVKIQLDTVYNPNKSHNVPKEIKTRVFLPVDKTVPIEDREFKSEPEVITCLNDLRKLFHFGCTVRFVLKINKFWIQKQLCSEYKIRPCGIIFKCMQIYVLNDPDWFKFKFNQNKPINIHELTNIKKYETDDDEEEDDDDGQNTLNWKVKDDDDDDDDGQNTPNWKK